MCGKGGCGDNCHLSLTMAPLPFDIMTDACTLSQSRDLKNALSSVKKNGKFNTQTDTNGAKLLKISKNVSGVLLSEKRAH